MKSSNPENPFWPLRRLPQPELDEKIQKVRDELPDVQGTGSEPARLLELSQLTVEQANREEGPGKLKLVTSALGLCERAMGLIDPESDPRSLAHAHHCKGMALRLLAAFQTGEKKRDILEKVIGSYHLALREFTPETAPADFATVSYHTGYALLLMTRVDRTIPKEDYLKRARSFFERGIPVLKNLNPLLYKKSRIFIQGIDMVLDSFEKRG